MHNHASDEHSAQRISGYVLLMACVSLVVVTACTQGPLGLTSSEPAVAPAPAPPLLAVRYEWPVGGLTASPHAQQLEADFQRCAALGFSAVWVDGIGDEDWPDALRAAQATDLRLISCRNAMRDYLRYKATAAAGQDAASIKSDLVRNATNPHADLAALVRTNSIAVNSPTHAVQLANLLCTQDPTVPVLWLDPTVVRPSEPTLTLRWRRAGSAQGPPARQDNDPAPLIARIQFEDQPDASGADIAADLQHAYYVALAKGATGGLLIWRWRSWPDVTNGVTGPDGSIDRQAEQAIETLNTRCKAWAHRLVNATLLPATICRLDGDTLRAAVFQRDKRCAVLVYNDDTRRFGRGQIAIPASVAGCTYHRAVAQTTGERYPITEGNAQIPLRLRPGDAELFELF